MDKDKRVTFSEACNLTASRIRLTVPVGFGPTLVTESTALRLALGLPVRLAGRLKWVRECRQTEWEIDGSNQFTGCAKSPCSVGLPMLAQGSPAFILGSWPQCKFWSMFKSSDASVSFGRGRCQTFF